MRFLLFFIATLGFGADDIRGFWKTVNSQGNPECVFAIYEYDGAIYGRIIGIFDEDGKMQDTIYTPTRRAKGCIDNPYFCGLDIVWGLYDCGERFKGKIVDPEKGNVYSCELWIENGNLIVRGKLFMFGKNYTWYPVKESDFPKDFKKPDLTELTPSFPPM